MNHIISYTILPLKTSIKSINFVYTSTISCQWHVACIDKTIRHDMSTERHGQPKIFNVK